MRLASCGFFRFKGITISTFVPTAKAAPIVSIVTATYNRSNVLRLVVECVLDSTFADWELIVIGDACTDDTEAVVTAFEDSRIRFVNLQENVGEQSGPNNAGCRLARGKYIAYLNHDDLWFPDHLEKAVGMLESGGPDLVFSAGVRIHHDGLTEIAAVTRSGGYESHVSVPASLWVFRRELLDEIGPWRSARDIYSPPSQDWLYRAAAVGKRIQLNPEVTVVLVPSAHRKRSYAERASAEHERIYAAMKQPDQLRATLCTEAAIRYAKLYHGLEIAGLQKMTAFRVLCRILRILKIPYYSFWAWISYRRKGGFIDKLRRHRGLPPLRKGVSE